MFLFSIKGIAITASFRVPETHTFHQTLPLPPKTTITGMIGAALGLNLEEAHKYVEQNKILIGVYGKHKGMMKDLWNYRKLTGDDYTVEDIKNRLHYSILIREYLYYSDFLICFGSNKIEPLEQLRKAMASPVYTITAGNSDDLFKICKISNISHEKEEKIKQFEYTILPGDFSKSYKHDINFNVMPITRTIYTPQVFLLPTRFAFDGEKRKVIERKPFTFVSSPVVIETPIEGYTIDNKKVVLQ